MQVADQRKSSVFPHTVRVISGFRNVKGFLIVADNDSTGNTFRTVQDALAENGWTPPASPDALGNIDGKPVAVFLVPSVSVNGDLEHLVLPAIHDKWPRAQTCVDTFLACTGADKWTKAASINKARARAAAVGFYEPDPFKGIGHLFRNGTLSANHACLDGLANYLAEFDARMGI